MPAAIALHYGSDATASGLEHRFRPIRKHVAAIRKTVQDGKDAKDMAGIFNMSDKGMECGCRSVAIPCFSAPCRCFCSPPPSCALFSSSTPSDTDFPDIAKYYGESTPQGIEFQFRTIRKDAKALREGVDKGESPLAIRRNVAPSPAGRKRKAPAAAAVAAATAAAGPSNATNGRGNASAAARTPGKRARTIDLISDEDDNAASEEIDYDQLDLTPISTPSRNATSATFRAGAASQSAAGAAPFTPSMTGAYAADATPALSTGATPVGQESPENADTLMSMMPGRRQAVNASHYALATPTSARIAAVHVYGDRDDDEDDNDVLTILDTPSKPPKIEDTSAASMSALGFAPNAVHDVNDFGSWATLDHQHGVDSQSQHFSFDSSGSWAPADFFRDSNPMDAFSRNQPFNDNDGAI